MRKVLSFLLMFVLLVTVFPGSIVDAAIGKTVKVTGEIIKVNPGMPYNKDMLALKTANETYILNGKLTAKMEKYLNCTVSVKGSIYTGPQGILMFNATSFTVVKRSKPSPVPAVTPTTATVTQTPEKLINDIQLKGILYNVDSSKIRFLLKTEKGPYELMGNTSGLENQFGKTLVVTGNYVYTLVATEYPLFSVISYEVIDTPTPSPIATPTSSSTVKTITIDDNGGYAYINQGDELKLILEGNKTTGYSWNYIEKPDPLTLVQTNYEYITDTASELIVGVGGKEIWTYKAVGEGTTIINMAYSRIWESVSPAKTFVIKVIVNGLPTPKPTIPTPQSETIKGTLIVTPYDLVPVDRIVPSYSFQLKTEKGPVNLQGKTAGLEKYNNYTIVAYGVYSMLAIYPPIFIVESYKVIDPTPVPVTKNHTIISDKALYFSEPAISSTGTTEASGYSTISWTEGTDKAFFKAKIKAYDSLYEFELVAAKITDSESIKGLFSVSKNGILIAKEIPGQLYGLSQPLGSYFKFYSDDMQWHMSAYVTNRLDF